MSGAIRPFDDYRYPDLDGKADCFLCGRAVDPRDPNRGGYDEPPAGPRFPIHLPCLNGRTMVAVGLAYHIALTEMSNRTMKVAGLR